MNSYYPFPFKFPSDVHTLKKKKGRKGGISRAFSVSFNATLQRPSLGDAICYPSNVIHSGRGGRIKRRERKTRKGGREKKMTTSKRQRGRDKPRGIYLTLGKARRRPISPTRLG